MVDKLIVELASSEDSMEPEKIEAPFREDYKLEEKPSWKNRRRVIFWSLIFCVATWVWILGSSMWGVEIADKIAETALTMSAFLAGSVIGGYVFGATWETVGMNKK